MDTHITEAYRIGQDICEANGGYHFRVHLKSGQTVEGMPELPNGTPTILMNAYVGGDCPISVIPYESIEYIDVIEV